MDVATGQEVVQHYCGRPLDGTAQAALPARPAVALPEGFDPALYLKANPDVAAAGADAATHWRHHGRFEGRRLRPWGHSRSDGSAGTDFLPQIQILLAHDIHPNLRMVR